MRAIQITEFGGPEVLHLVDLPDPAAPAGLAVLDVTSAGVNYADTHQVEDSYLSRSQLPMVPGSEVAGTLPDGRRVAGFTSSGGYAEKAVVHPSAVVHSSVALGASSSWVASCQTCLKITPARAPAATPLRMPTGLYAILLTALLICVSL